MSIIDADAHVIETEQTWTFMLEEDRRFAPEVLVSKKNGIEFWRIDDRVVPNSNLGLNVPEDARDLTDVSSRLGHMDALGIDIQVLYPSLFLRPLTSRSEVDLALCRGYNRLLAHVWQLGKGRLRWIVLPPLRTMEQAIEEINFGKANGACGVFMRGNEGERLLSDSSLFPLYKEAERLDLPICVHAGGANPAFRNLVAESFSGAKLPVISAFHTLLYNGIPNQFPRLRFGFVEASASWVPYVITDLRRRLIRDGRPPLSENPLGDNRMYVACQTNDDLPYIVQCVGDDNLVIGSDYGHSDTSSELEALRNLHTTCDLPSGVITKILEDNPRTLYGL